MHAANNATAPTGSACNHEVHNCTNCTHRVIMQTVNMHLHPQGHYAWFFYSHLEEEQFELLQWKHMTKTHTMYIWVYPMLQSISFTVTKNIILSLI